MRNLLVGGLIGAVAGGLVVYFLLWRPELERPVYRRSPPASPEIPSRRGAAGGHERAPAPARETRPVPAEPVLPREASATPPGPPDRAHLHVDDIARTAPLDRKPAATLRREDVKDAIRGARPIVKRCYEQALRSNPKLAGTLKVQFTVSLGGGRGRLKDAEILDDGLGNPFLGMCVLKALAEVEYPGAEGSGEVVVTYPFRMEPDPEEDE